MKSPRIALPQPTSSAAEYNQRSWPQYAHAIQSCGGIAVPIPLGESQANVARLISGCSGILLPGSPADVNPQKYSQPTEAETSPSDPDREAVDELLLQDAFNLRKPILGICYGLQALNVWRNGTLRQHIQSGLHKQSKVENAHPIALTPGSHIASIGGDAHQNGEKTWVNSSHHQSVDIPGDGMQVVALSPEDGVIEALELAPGSQFVLGVQWHPERTFGTNALSRAIFQSFVDAASDWKLQPIQESVVPVASCQK
ncbi:MAG TPA: gamma-glutamyl-gamma-aminobutyrate hydrolase family protein [Acidisarcina sp.]|nr:gamma-glutamyl-gamma-aminobutyrate hydrolase family protein [Acidisarcina sp.]